MVRERKDPGGSVGVFDINSAIVTPSTGSRRVRADYLQFYPERERSAVSTRLFSFGRSAGSYFLSGTCLLPARAAAPTLRAAARFSARVERSTGHSVPIRGPRTTRRQRSWPAGGQLGSAPGAAGDLLPIARPPQHPEATDVRKLLPQLWHGVRIRLSCDGAGVASCTVGCTWPASLGPISRGRASQGLMPRLCAARM